MLHEILKSYFDRQIRMYEIGEAGIERLRKAHVAVVGVGGLGSFSSLLLALNGVGRLTLIDPDIVEVSNLNRQILYYPSDAWLFKTEAAYKRLKQYAPHVKINAYPLLLNPRTINVTLKNVDIILDGLDNMPSRYLLNRYCVKKKIPYVFTRVSGFEYNISFIKVPETPCLECFYSNIDDQYALKSIRERGIINSTVAYAVSIQVSEAVKYLVGISPSLKNRLLIGDLKSFSQEFTEIRKNLKCQSCSSPDYSELSNLYTNDDTVIMDLGLKLAPDRVASTLRDELTLVRMGELGVVFNKGEIVVGVSSHGALVVKNADIRYASKLASKLTR